MSLLFNMLSRFVIAFVPRSRRLLISWLQSPSALILEPKKIKSVIVSIVSPSIFHEVMGPDAMILVFWMLRFKPDFLLSFFTFIKRLFSSFLLTAIRVVSSAYLRLLILWDECNCVVVWTFFGIVFLWDWSENCPFPGLWPLLSFPNGRGTLIDSICQFHLYNRSCC